MGIDSNTSIIRSLVTLVFRYRWVIFLSVFLTVSLSLLHHKYLPSYRASSKLHVQSPEGSPLMSTMAKISGSPINPYSQHDFADKYLKILRSNGYGKFLFNHLKGSVEDTAKFKDFVKLKTEKYTDQDIQTVVDSLISSTEYRKVDFDIININAAHKDSSSSIRIANFMSTIAIDFIINYENQEIEDAQKYLKSELLLTQKRIDKINSKIEYYKKNELTTQQNSADSSIRKLQEELEMAKVKLEQNNLLLIQFSERQQEIVKQQASQRSVASAAPLDIMNNRGRLVDLMQALREEKKSLNSKIQAIATRLNILYSSRTPKYEQKIYENRKQLELEHSFLQTIQRQLFDTSVQKISIRNRVRAYDPADTKSISAVVPLPKRVLFTFITTLVGVLLLLYLWEHINPVILTRADLANLGLIYLGHVPTFIKTMNPLSKIGSSSAGPARGYTQFDSEATMAFRYLRTRIHQILEKNNDPDIISVISPTSNDGKSVLSTNLAMSFAHLNKKTIIIDSDFRKASLSKTFSSTSDKGLYEYLLEDASISEIVNETDHEYLYYMPAGHFDANHSDVLSSGKMKELLDQLKTEFDYIIIDTPAFQATPDALILTELADLPLIVTNYGRTKTNHLAELVETLLYHNIENIYTVLNQYDARLSGPTNLYYINMRKQRRASND